LWPALRRLTWRERLQAMLLVPAIRVSGDVAKMIGYPLGWLWRLRRLPHQPELRWRNRR
jgi:hypothetical protein